MTIRTMRLGLAITLAVTLSGPAAFAKKPRRLRSKERAEAAKLRDMANLVARGRFSGGDAWLKWSNHFLRGPDGRTYVPFTIVIAEAPRAFQSIAVYIRAATPGEDPSVAEERRKHGRRILGNDPGELPVFVPERNASDPYAPIGGEASRALQMAQRHVEPAYPFEDVYFVDFPASDDDRPHELQRALSISAGTYDIFLALKERDHTTKHPKSAVLKETLTVPDFSGDALALSSIILADEIRPLKAPLTEREQIDHPYALGPAEIIPSANSNFTRHDNLMVVMFVYNPAADAAHKPDVTVKYRFFGRPGATETLFRQTAPQQLDATTLPPAFDLERAGRQLPVSQTVPLKSFPPGWYRLQVTVTDNIRSAAVTGNIHFIVLDDAPRTP